MKKITVSISALVLALGVLSGCGEKKEEAPKAEAPAAQEGMSGMSGMAAEQAAAPAADAAPAAQEGMSGMSGMAAEQAAAPTGAVDGEKVYKGLCFSCHDAGVAGAPKLGDKAEWGPRIATGADTLHAAAINGKNTTPGKVMPAKGGNPALSDEEVKAAVDYMISKAQ